ncbi:deubiquitinase and deneddylase Dub1-like [Palaemon carinicauda]|uniref:deubiquitinase and deneddylase Dub1-like n=1 Tax=Palaemon carinicauda TaxID=392227 RepID=UPI0035B591D0
MQISRSRLLVVSLLLIIGVQPAVPRNIYHPGVSPFGGVERTAPLPPFNRGNPPCRGSFQYVSFRPESNLDEDETRRSYLRVGDTDIYEWRSRSTSGGYGYYICQDGLAVIRPSSPRPTPPPPPPTSKPTPPTPPPPTPTLPPPTPTPTPKPTPPTRPTPTTQPRPTPPTPRPAILDFSCLPCHYETPYGCEPAPWLCFV